VDREAAAAAEPERRTASLARSGSRSVNVRWISRNDFPAKACGLAPIERDCHVEASPRREGAGRRALLHVQKLAQGVIAQVRQVGVFGMQRRDRHVRGEVRHRHEGDRLVGGTFHEQLHLAVLVSGAERRDGRGPHVVAVRPLLAEALGPELDEPPGEVTQPVGVRHEHLGTATVS
jgi:hypothetical protein